MAFVLNGDRKDAVNPDGSNQSEELSTTEACRKTEVFTRPGRHHAHHFLGEQSLESDEQSLLQSKGHFLTTESGKRIPGEAGPASPDRRSRKASLIGRALRSFRRCKDSHVNSIPLNAPSINSSDVSKPNTNALSEHDHLKEDDGIGYDGMSQTRGDLSLNVFDQSSRGLRDLCDMSLSSDSNVDIWEREDSMSIDGVQGSKRNSKQMLAASVLSLNKETTERLSIINSKEGPEGLLDRSSCDDVIEMLGLGKAGEDAIATLRVKQSIPESSLFQHSLSHRSIPRVMVMGIPIPNYQWYVRRSVFAFRRDVLKISDATFEFVPKVSHEEPLRYDINATVRQ